MFNYAKTLHSIALIHCYEHTPSVGTTAVPVAGGGTGVGAAAGDVVLEVSAVALLFKASPSAFSSPPSFKGPPKFLST